MPDVRRDPANPACRGSIVRHHKADARDRPLVARQASSASG